MGTVSSGGPGTPGAPAYQDFHEMTTNAAAQNARLSMGIAANTIDLVFTQLGGNIWRYDASSENPLLPMHKDVQVHFSNAQKADTALEEHNYKSLVLQLPPAIRQNLMLELKKPLDDRDAGYMALDTMLKFMASSLAGAPPVASAASLLRTELNVALAAVVVQNALAGSEGLLHGLENQWASAGLDPGIIADMRGVSAQLSSTLNSLKTAQKALSQLSGSDADPALKQKVKTSVDNDLKAIKGLVEQLKSEVHVAIGGIVADNLSLVQQLLFGGSTAPTVVSTLIALTGAEAGSSATGFMGLSELQHGLLAGIKDSPEKQAMDSLAVLVFLAAAGLSSGDFLD